MLHAGREGKSDSQLTHMLHEADHLERQGENAKSKSTPHSYTIYS